MGLSGCAFRSHEVDGISTADALSESYPADAERFAIQAALELSRRYPAGQTGLCLVTVPGMFGTALEANLRGQGFAILQESMSSGVRVGYVIDEIAGEIAPTGYLQIRTSDGTNVSFVRKLLGGLPSTAATPPQATLPPVEDVTPGTRVLLPPTTATPSAVPTVQPLTEKPLPVSSPAPTVPATTSTNPSTVPTAPPKTPEKHLPIITAVRTIIPVGWQYSVQGGELRQAHVPYPRNVAC